MIFDGKSDAKLSKKIWLIKHKFTGEIVFEYRTFQGNKKKAFFNSFKHADEALKKYIRDPEMYFLVTMDAGEEDE